MIISDFIFSWFYFILFVFFVNALVKGYYIKKSLLFSFEIGFMMMCFVCYVIYTLKWLW